MTKKIDLLEAAESLPSQKAKKREESADKARIKQLETLLEKQTEQIEQTRDSSFKLNIGKKRGASNKRGDFVRVVIPDSHGSQIDPLAARAFLNDLEEIQPTEIILLGDQIECGGFLAQHHTLGYVAETAYTYADDIGAANQFLDEIQSRCPKARIDALEGNHERRIERWIVDQTLGRQRDAEYLRSKFSPELELNMKRRGIDYFNQGVYYDGLPIPATIRRGKCHFSHGEYCGKHSASQHLAKYGGNIVFAHTHRADSHIARTVSQGVIGAWNSGCLCLLQRYYMHTNFSDHSHGYGVQLVKPDGGFLHINIPIISGESYLSPLISHVGKKV